MIAAQSFSKDQHAGEWDVVVIGAGPAGALAAYLLARRSLRTLLVEKEAFPRHKVCGGCLNDKALGILEAEGLGDVCDTLKATRTDTLRLVCGGRAAEIALPRGRAVSRRAFDSALVAGAIKAGAEFVHQTRAYVLPSRGNDSTRAVELHDSSGHVGNATAKIILAADGLGHPSLGQLSGFDANVDSDSLIGLGAVITGQSRVIHPNVITMAVGRQGYVGSVVVEDGQLNVAAAVDSFALKRLGAESTVSSILLEAGVVNDALRAAQWSGTRPLTCHSTRVADHRLFLLGDATGYVEPFTGQGMAWALSSAIAVAPLAEEACHEWQSDFVNEWQEHHELTVSREQRLCRAVSRLLRRPYLMRSVVALLGCCPRLVSPLVHRVARPFRIREVQI